MTSTSLHSWQWGTSTEPVSHGEVYSGLQTGLIESLLRSDPGGTRVSLSIATFLPNSVMNLGG